MDAHPSVGVNPPGQTTPEPFAPEAIYELKIDTDGDHVADIAYRVRFSSVGGNNQTATVRRVTGADAADIDGDGELVVEDAPVSLGSEPTIVESNGYRFFAGWRSDPFFFDAGGALNEWRSPAMISSPTRTSVASRWRSRTTPWARRPGSVSGIARWCAAMAPGRAGSRPIVGRARSRRCSSPGEQRAAYLGGEPADDGRFVDGFAHALRACGWLLAEEAGRWRATCCPTSSGTTTGSRRGTRQRSDADR